MPHSKLCCTSIISTNIISKREAKQLMMARTSFLYFPPNLLVPKEGENTEGKV